MRVFTIGFTKKSARHFFESLHQSGAKRVLDVRLNNVSQLAGFAKKGDLAYFLKEICGIDYLHSPDLAPTQEMLDAYKKKRGDWSTFEAAFIELMKKRRVEAAVSKELVAHSCLLCSEATPDHCHRRLVGEYFQQHWSDVEIVHLM